MGRSFSRFVHVVDTCDIHLIRIKGTKYLMYSYEVGAETVVIPLHGGYQSDLQCERMKSSCFMNKDPY